eukprot:gene12085-10426_t
MADGKAPLPPDEEVGAAAETPVAGADASPAVSASSSRPV